MVAGLLAFAVACARPDLSVEGLHQPCPEEGCTEGQECITAPSPEGDLSTCEIPCRSDLECPEGTACALPPVEPEALAYVCIEA